MKNEFFYFKQWPFHVLNFFMLLIMLLAILQCERSLPDIIAFVTSGAVIAYVVLFCYGVGITIDDKSIRLARVIKGTEKKIFREIEWDSVTEILTNQKKNKFYTAVVQGKDKKRVYQIIRLHSDVLIGYEELMKEVLRRARNAKIDAVTQKIANNLRIYMK